MAKKNSNPILELEIIKKNILQAEEKIEIAKKMLEDLSGKSSAQKIDTQNTSKIILGVFNGEQMKSENGKIFSIPANYASKSKLVEGDELKLTILDDGTFLYKQIGPVGRKKLKGILKISKNQFFVETDDKKYQILPASATYFKAEKGDTLTIIVPEVKLSKWAAVENIVPKE